MDRAKRLVTAIEQLNISGYKVQQDLGISSGTISNYRSGNSQPRESIIDSFCRTYGVSKQWILTGEGDLLNGKVITSKAIRFLKVVDQIKIDNDITYKDIANELNSYSSLMSELRAGKTSVKDEWIETLVGTYGVNKEYITDGTGGMYIEQNTDGRTYRELMKEVEILRQVVADLKKDKAFLQSVIEKNSLQ